MTEDDVTQERLTSLEVQLANEVAIRNRLVEAAKQLNSTFNLSELLQLVLGSATDLLEAETGSLMLLDEDTGDLTIELTTGSTEADVAKSRVPAGQGIAGWVLEHREPALVDDPAADPRFYAELDAATGFQTVNLLAVPLLARDRPVGVLEVINKLGDGSFTDADLELSQAFAGLAAIALDNAALYAKLTDAVVTARMSYRL